MATTATAPTTTSDNSALLGLPVELVQRIASYLPEESLIPVRRTCKVLDATTFDLFVAAYVADQSCWIYGQQRRERLDSMFASNSRLAKRIKSVTLTVDVLEATACQNLDTVVPVVLEERFDTPGVKRILKVAEEAGHGELFTEALRVTKTQTGYCICENETMALGPVNPSFALISWVMAGIESHECELTLDLATISGADIHTLEPPPIHRDVLSAVAITRAPISVLRLAPFTCVGLDDLLSKHETLISESLRSVTLAEYYARGRFLQTGQHPNNFYSNENDFLGLSAAKKILSLIPELEGFSANLNQVEIHEHFMEIGCSVLFANNFGALGYLDLSEMCLDQKTTLQALNSCRPTLVGLRLASLCVLGHPETWKRIWLSLSTTPHLAQLQLYSLWSEMDDKWFGLVLRPAVPGVNKRDLELWNKEDIAEGLSRLLKQPDAWVEG